MKRHKILSFAVLVAGMLVSNSCKNLLVEKPQSQIVPSFFSTPAGLLGGIAGVYNDIRNYWGTEGFTINQMAGTDEYLAGGSAGNPRVFTYNGIQTTDFNGGFNVYTDINTLNGVLEIGPTSGIAPATLQAYIGQAQFLRAFLYFYLVQTYGNIPLHTTFITTPTQSDAPASATDIYTLIVSDLTSAIANLPAQPTSPFLGKAATSAAAKWLLAKVYLTRGWLLSTPADFQSAYDTASALIANKVKFGLDLWQDYADAFKPANDYGKETILVSDHDNDAKFGEYQVGSAGGSGVNVTPWMGLFNGPSVIGINSIASPTTGQIVNTGPQMLFRDVQFGRPFTRIRPNMPRLATGPNAGKSYLLDQAFADRNNDSRYSKTFQTVWLANLGGGAAAYSGNGTTGTRGTLTCGKDTAVWMPDYEVSGAPQAFGARPFKGIIVTPSMQSATVYPYMKKLADPSRTAPNDPSERPVVIARFSEVYLIAAEAAFKLGQMQNAADMINAVRQRAAYRTGAAYTPGGAFGLSTTPTQMNGDPYPVGVTYASAVAAQTILSTDVTLDFILDERTREFYGESVRWLDLVRTQSLQNRINAWNPTEAGTNFKPCNTVRPIPQDEINLVVVGPPFPQNDCYK
jgi:hypothetical protein